MQNHTTTNQENGNGWQQPNYGGQWQQPNYGGQWQQSKEAKPHAEKMGFAIASFVLGILSILCCFVYGGILGAVGLAFGLISCVRKEARRGFAIAGIVTSVIGILYLLFQVVFLMGIISWGMYEENVRLEDIRERIREGRSDMQEEGHGTDDDADTIYGMDDKNDDVYDVDVSDATALFAGEAFEASDGSVICFEEDGDFHWYQDDAEHTDNYYAGTYEVYGGEEAVEYITGDLAAYGVTRDELEDYFMRNSGDTVYNWENCTALMLRTEEAVVGGESQTSVPYERYYMGFMADGCYDAANMGSGESAFFTVR